MSSQPGDQTRNLRPAKWGSTVSLRSNNPEPRMSARVTSGELVLFATLPLRSRNPTFAPTSSGATSGLGRVKTLRTERNQRGQGLQPTKQNEVRIILR